MIGVIKGQWTFAAQKKRSFVRITAVSIALRLRFLVTSTTVTAFCVVGGHERSNLVSIVSISVFFEPFSTSEAPRLA